MLTCSRGGWAGTGAGVRGGREDGGEREKGRQEKGRQAGQRWGALCPGRKLCERLSRPNTPHGSARPGPAGQGWLAPLPAGCQTGGRALTPDRPGPHTPAPAPGWAVLSGERGPCPPGGPAANPLFIPLGVGFCTARPRLCAALPAPRPLPRSAPPRPQAPGKAGSSCSEARATHVLRGGGGGWGEESPRNVSGR